MTTRQPERMAGLTSITWLLIAACLMMQACASTARSNDRDRLVRERLYIRIQDILSHAGLAQTTVGVKVVSLRSGETLFEHQADRLFNPASNTKLFTATAALKTLGPDYRFTTTLSLDAGSLKTNDTLYTALYLKGTGDPLLDTEALQGLADSLVRFDIHTLAGDVIVDDTCFDDVRLGKGWMWDDVPYGFSAQISALTVNGNCVTVVVTPGDTIGAPVDVRLEPPTSYVKMRVQAATASDDAPDSVRTPLRIERQWQTRQNVIVVTGEIPLGPSERRAVQTVEDPALYTATLFRELLAAAGVYITGDIRRGAIPPQVKEIAVHRSEPLTEAVAHMLKDSDNLTAELLVKTMGVHGSGSPGATAHGIRVVRQVATEVAGLDTLQYVLVDGSGLSRYNQVTPAQVTALLSSVYHDPALRAPIMTALPIAGVDGTLEDRIRPSETSRKIMAKTGTMAGVSCLSGFVYTRDDEPLAFSIMMNHYIGSSRMSRQAQDEIGAVLADFSRRPRFVER